MTCNIAQPGGYMGQIGRNMKLEPLFGANSRSVDGSDRDGEVKADKLQIGLGIGVGAAFGLGAAKLAHVAKTGNVSAGWRGGLGVLAGVAALGGAYFGATALAGWKNLGAKLDCGDGGKKPDQPKGPDGPKGPDKTDPGKNKPTVLTHEVVRGDTLTDIANCNDVSVENLYTYNQDTIGDNGNRIMPGMKLVIPPKDYQGPGATFDPTAPRNLPQNQCVAPIPGSALEPCK